MWHESRYLRSGYSPIGDAVDVEEIGRWVRSVNRRVEAGEKVEVSDGTKKNQCLGCRKVFKSNGGVQSHLQFCASPQYRWW